MRGSDSQKQGEASRAAGPLMPGREGKVAVGCGGPAVVSLFTNEHQHLPAPDLGGSGSPTTRNTV